MQILDRYKIEERENVGVLSRVLPLVIALVGALLIAALLIVQAGGDPVLALISIFKGAFGGKREILETLVRTSPLLLVAVGTVIVFRGSIWNIGQQGQLIAGAMFSYWVYTFIQDWPRLPMLVIIVLAGFIGGAFIAYLGAILQAKFRVDIVIGTILLSYIVLYLFSMLLWDHDYWMDPLSYNPIGPKVIEAAQLPTLVEGSRLHLGIVLGVIAALVIAWVLRYSSFGLDIRAVGFNPIASKFKGINYNKTLILAMVISGGLCGLAGVGEAFGLHHRLDLNMAPGYGFTGLICAMLGGLDPIGAIAASIFFGAMINGGVRMVTATSVPTAIIPAMQAIVLIFLLMAQVISTYRIRRVGDV
jgi:general nucleoside transport system permease protein